MQWLALYFPGLPLEVFTRGEESEMPAAVIETGNGRQRILRCNRTAAERGVAAGMALAEALALESGLRLFERDTSLESRVMDGLASGAYQYSSFITFDPLVLLLEIGGSLRLFGGIEQLSQRMEADFTALGYVVRCASAPTPIAAWLLARNRPASHVLTVGELPEVLADIPLRRLTRDPQLGSLVQGIGLASIGDCLALPRPELARRSGPRFLQILDRLLGRIPDPRLPWQPPAQFDERLLLVAEIDRTAALLFPARRLILSLSLFMRGRGGGAQRLQWSLRHRDGAETVFSQGMQIPARDPEQLLAIFRERIERLQLPQPVMEMRLRVDDWQPFEERSGSLFSEAMRVEEDGLLNCLRARLGESRVRGLQYVADHRPERAWRYTATLDVTGVDERPAIEDGAWPLWLLPQPQRLDMQREALQIAPWNERIESGWWDGGDVRRDYYRAVGPAGERLWIYRDLRTGEWYWQGGFD